LFAAGTEVIINGTVGGSLVAAGQTVIVNGQVRGSVYGAGASVVLQPSAAVGRNAYVAGYSLATESGSRVSRDVFFGGYQAILSGAVGEDVTVGAAALEVNGRIDGDVRADVAADDDTMVDPFSFGQMEVPRAIEPGLRISPEASIGGELVYTSPERQSGSIRSQPEGGTVYQTPVPDRGERTAVDRGPRGVLWIISQWILGRVRDLLTLLILGLLVIWLLPTLLYEVVEDGRTEPLPALLWGLVVLVVGLLVAGIIAMLILVIGLVLGLITFGGLASAVFGLGFSALGFAFTLFVLLITYGSKLVVAYLVGDWILREASPQTTEKPIWPLLLGVLLYVIVRGIPILGWLVGLVVTLLGLGAMWLRFQRWYNGRRTATVES
jgi:hypothetical protein